MIWKSERGELRLLFIPWAYCFCMKKILVDFYICISLPLKLVDMGEVALP